MPEQKWTVKMSLNTNFNTQMDFLSMWVEVLMTLSGAIAQRWIPFMLLAYPTKV